MSDLFCEVCNAPANVVVQDFVEAKPVDGWKTYKEIGSPHALCSAHDRPARMTDNGAGAT